jgi:hypothetical protein
MTTLRQRADSLKTKDGVLASGGPPPRTSNNNAPPSLPAISGRPAISSRKCKHDESQPRRAVFYSGQGRATFQEYSCTLFLGLGISTSDI